MDTQPNTIPNIPEAASVINPAPKGLSKNTKLAFGVAGCLVLLCCVITTVTTVFVVNKAREEASKKESVVKTTMTVKPTLTPTKSGSTTQKYTEKVFYPDGGTYPISQKFADEMIGKTRLLGAQQGYATAINSFGNPTYNFSLLYDMKWKQESYTSEKYILNSSDKKTNSGMLFFSRNDKDFNATCEHIVKNVYKAYSLTVNKTETVRVNGESWDRVYYTVRNNAANLEQKGIDQCVKKSDALLLHFIVADSTLWTTKGDEYKKVMDDIYIRKVQ